ncbi:acyl CoA--acetate/3-ketoacid CoA transferase subunit beta [Geomonas paludis]|uniref:Acyl CoA--acetate/3-ketoacid CoA transferase subunit beta n=2 Tax=Geomonas TaxID=2651583 RepID=A0A6V8MVX0_9BACT|nr:MULTISPECIES: CoA-transferase [Geomonas]MBJ6749451.1 acyl CoA--acetate/3-ketoacid CoA transferase subunit beta [Geomonas anaerohicana]UPU37417.1 acyl CoA--acetate/3-ketoacid CoA transferase subunit beta [Geomonas paludis]GFO64014.1 glutaconate CoA-transferase [Geomonas paludis]
MNKEFAKPEEYGLADLLCCAASREVQDNEIVFAGTGLPMVAIMLAQKTHAPNLKLIFEAGTLDGRPPEIPTSVGDARCEMGASRSSGLHDAFSIAQRGYVDLGFLGGAEVDQYGNVNTTCIGDYLSPELRLTGSGGNPDINSFAKRTVFIMVHEKRRFTEQVSYITSPGWRVRNWPGGETVHRRELYGAAYRGGPSAVISTLGVFRFDEESGRIYLDTCHAGNTPEQIRDMCQFDLDISRVSGETLPPTREELHYIHEVLDPEQIFIPKVKPV